VEEIGWDLPELLINFFDLEWDYQGSLLRDTELITSIMRLFDLVAKNGNSKELFLKSIELLANLDDLNPSNEKEFNIIDIKLHTLIELLSTSLKRINTIYPSRFLSMAITALLKVSNSYISKTIHIRFILRRLYTFARDYIPPMKPKDYISKHEITIEEAKKIEDDENYLQRILLQSFLTQLAEISFTLNTIDLSVELYKSLQYKTKGILPPPNDEDNEQLITSSRGLFSRITQLSLSYDMDLPKLFDDIKKSSLKLLSKIDLTKSDDEKIQDILKFSINDKISSIYNPDSEKIPQSMIGELFFITQYTKEVSSIFPITLHEAIAITLRFLSPGLISEKFQNKGMIDISLFWCWVSLISSKSTDFSKIPNHELILFLQIVIYYASIDVKPSIRIVAYTLLTRVLTSVKEDISYNFLIDTLTTAPFMNAKAAVVSILKDLVIRVKTPEFSIDSITKDLSNSKLNESDETEDDSTPKPKLPTRHYIELNQSRIDDIYALIRESIDETFPDDEGEELNTASFKVTLGYLNFLIAIKQRFSNEKLNEIIKVCDEKLEKLGDVEIDDPSINIEFINMALDSLRK